MKYYTGVGSRETPKEILDVMENLAYKLSIDGWILRSGGAEGADTAFENGHCSGRKQEIYLPWKGGNHSGAIVPSEFNNWDKAVQIASEIHPAWDRCSDAAKKLHSRNIYQVLGKDLSTLSKFLICYAKPSGGSVQGGTRTAWECAKMNNIPCFNLYNGNTLNRINKYLEK